MGIERETSIVGVIEDEQPLSFVIAQPVMHKLEYISRGISPLRDPNAVCDLPIALRKPRRVARVNLEYPCLWRLSSNSVGIFDGKLGLSALESAAVFRVLS